MILPQTVANRSTILAFVPLHPRGPHSVTGAIGEGEKKAPFAFGLADSEGPSFGKQRLSRIA